METAQPGPLLLGVQMELGSQTCLTLTIGDTETARIAQQYLFLFFHPKIRRLQLFSVPQSSSEGLLLFFGTS